MRVTYPKLTRTLEVAVNYRNGNSRSREPKYKIFGKIARWRNQVSEREKEPFTKLPDQSLTLPQSLLEYINHQLPDNPLCIFKPNGLLPESEKKALSMQELYTRFHDACIDLPEEVAGTAPSTKGR